MSLLIVSSMVTVFSFVEVAAAAHELVSGGVQSNGRRGRHGSLEAALEDPFDVATVRRAPAGDRKSAQARGVHPLGAVLLGAAQDAEHGAIAHLGLRVTSERAPHDPEHPRSEFLGPREHRRGRPVAVNLV